ncbi:MAG: outer membrane receptor protein involved in Fe transport [Porticoccus sp.]|jgi:outer membrane receptor protein involved in Fe transport
MKFRINAIAAGMALVPALAISGTAGAQMLEEVIVTAQKRSESLMDVPISVNVVGGEMISNQGITNLNDLSDYVPNLSMNQTGLGTNVTIRGISSGINPAFEQSVGMYVDDIFYGRPQLARVPYLDIDRVEVLRGPQPILFGKNAIAGAISATTIKASPDEVEGFIESEYNFDQEGYEVSGAVNIPVSDTFAIRFAGLKRESDGYYDNTTLNKDESELDTEVLRANFQWDATENLSINLKVENSDFTTNGRFLEIVNPVGSPSYASGLSNATGGEYVLDTKQDFKRQSNGDYDETEVDNVTLTIDFALGDHTLTSITGGVQYDYFQQCDCDFTGVEVFQTAGSEEYEQFSQELRLSSPGGDTIDYIVGAYYSEYDVETDELLAFSNDSLFNTFPSTGLTTFFYDTGTRRNYETDSEQWSVFAQGTWNVSDELRVTVGGRYSEEDKTGSRVVNIVELNGATGPYASANFPVQDPLNTTTGNARLVYGALGVETEQGTGHNRTGKRSESRFTPAVTVQWDATDETMLYASYTEGFKAGGFDARSNLNDNFEFDEELATSIELGAKMSLADGAAELNVAIYRTEYDDLQTSQFDGNLGFNVTNAGVATTQGIELDGRWQVTDALYLTGALGYLDFEFDEFDDSQCYFGETPSSPNNDLTNPSQARLCDRGGDTREFAPELTANLGADYSLDISDDVGVIFGLNLAYSDDYFTSPTLDPNLVQDSYVKVNARIQLESLDGIWSVALLAENLTDEGISTFGNEAPLASAASRAAPTPTGGFESPRTATAYYSFYEAPRNVALKVRYNF